LGGLIEALKWVLIALILVGFIVCVCGQSDDDLVDISLGFALARQ